MFRNMVTSLFKHDRIRTTDAKAKELRRWADNMITLAKRGDLHARRQVLAIIREKDVVHKLFEEAGEKFGAVSGGYTRVVKIGRRPGDAAPISLVELIAQETAKKKTRKKKTKASGAFRKKAGAKKAKTPDASPLEEATVETAPEGRSAGEDTAAAEKKAADAKRGSGKPAAAEAPEVQKGGAIPAEDDKHPGDS